MLSLIVRDMQIKSKINYDFSSTKLKTQSLTFSNSGEDLEHLQLFYTYCGV